jgi:hypothetical protein
MPLPESSISRACRAIADYVGAQLKAAGSQVQVRLGAPWAAAPALATSDHALNFFFHRIEPSGFGPDTLPGEPWWMRLHCVITAFAVDEERISAGENDLRLIGEVIRILHEKPVLDAVDVAGEKVAAQMIFEPLSLDDVNRLWSAQKDVPYRLSIAYEVALVPVVPRRRAVAGPRVAAISAEVRAGDASAIARVDPPALAPPELDREDWAPRIAFATPGGPAQVMSLRAGDPDLNELKLRVLIAGAAGAPVTLSWDVWDPAAGWRAGPAAGAARAAFAAIPPGAVSADLTAQVSLPFTGTAGQAALYATRSYRRGDGAALEVRSNLLLVTLVGGDA